jgi:hypothetical protein
MEDAINTSTYHLSGLKERLREDFFMRPDIMITAKNDEDDNKLYHILGISGLRRFDLGTYTTFEDAQNALKGIHNMLEIIVKYSPVLKGGCE